MKGEDRGGGVRWRGRARLNVRGCGVESERQRCGIEGMGWSGGYWCRRGGCRVESKWGRSRVEGKVPGWGVGAGGRGVQVCGDRAEYQGGERGGGGSGCNDRCVGGPAGSDDRR